MEKNNEDGEKHGLLDLLNTGDLADIENPLFSRQHLSTTIRKRQLARSILMVSTVILFKICSATSVDEQYDLKHLKKKCEELADMHSTDILKPLVIKFVVEGRSQAQTPNFCTDQAWQGVSKGSGPSWC